MLIPRSHLREDDNAHGSYRSEDNAGQPESSTWLRLHRNERIVPFSQHEHDAMVSAILAADLIRYPEQGEVLSALSAELSVQESGLSLFAGSESAVRAIFDIMIDPGNLAICLAPSYHGYTRQSFMHQANLRRIHYDDAMNLDLEAVIDAISKDARLVILGSPDATGRALSPDFLRTALDRVERYGGLLVVDEAYHYFGAPSVLDLVPAHPQLVVLRTFSKAWGLAGIRCGFTIGEPSTTRLLRRARLRHEVSGPTLAIVAHALRRPELREVYAREIADSRDAMTRVLACCGFAVIPSVANFLVARVPEPGSADIVQAQARATGILLTKLSPHFIRLTIGPATAMQQAVRHFQSIGNLT